MSKNSSIKYDVIENRSDVDVEISPIEKTLNNYRYWSSKETRTDKFCHKVSICYPKGTKFNSSLTTKQDLVADIYWDNEDDNDKYCRVVSARIRGIAGGAFTFEWHSYDEQGNDFLAEKLAQEIVDEFSYLSRHFWNDQDCYDYKKIVTNYRNTTRRVFYKTFFNRTYKEILTDEQKNDYHDSKVTWKVSWSGIIHGVPFVDGVSKLSGKEFVELRTFANGEGKYKTLTFKVGEFDYTTTFGKYFDECIKVGDISSCENTDYNWSPHKIHALINRDDASLKVIDEAYADAQELKTPIQNVEFYCSDGWAGGCASESFKIRGVKTIKEFISKLFDKCSSGAEYINIYASSEDGLDDDWEWRADGREETFGYSEFDFDESITKWLSELVKED